MDAKKVKEKIDALHSEVYKQMTDVTKNEYDSEISMPQCEKKGISLKNSYNLDCREDTSKNKKRREKRPGKLEENIANGCIDEAKQMIKEQYYESITVAFVDELFLKILENHGASNPDLVIRELDSAGYIFRRKKNSIKNRLRFNGTLVSCYEIILPKDDSESDDGCMTLEYVLTHFEGLDES